MAESEDTKDKENVAGIPIKHVRYDEFFKDHMGKDSGQIYRVDAYKYNASTRELQLDYNIPTVYTRYSTDKSKRRRKPNTSSEPYMRLGHDNNYPFFLLKLLKLSHTHKRSYRTAVNLAYGNGLIIEESDGGADGEEFLSWLTQIGVNKYNFLKGALQSIAVFGGAYVHKIFSSSVEVNAKEVTVDVPTTKRLGKVQLRKYFQNRVGKLETEEDSDSFGKSEFHWEHPSYNDRSLDKKLLKGVKIFESFDESSVEDTTVVKLNKKDPFFSSEKLKVGNQGRYSCLIKEPNLFSDTYPEPIYETNSFINAVIIEDALGSRDVAGMENGMMAGFIVSVALADTSKRGDKGKELYEGKKAAIEGKVREELQGVDNAEQIIIMYRDPRTKGEAITITEIPHTNKSDMHKVIEERKDGALLTGWGIIDRRLIGSPQQVGQGMSDQAGVLETAEDLWYDNVIMPEIMHPLTFWIFEVMLPIWLQEISKTDTTIIGVSFSRKRLFNKRPSDEMVLKSYGIDERRAMHGDPEASDKVKKELGIGENIE